jgi:NAD(P)-dependent dehydrogenase (short-subunit alcohol dehydrogenase family)
MNRKVCLITGGNAGIGRETAFSLAKMGMSVVIVCRDYLKGKEATEYLRRAANNKRVSFIVADLSSQAQIHSLSEEFRKRYNRLDILINNAGVVMQKRMLTEDGYEYQLAVNHLAPFLITNLLIDLLIDSAPSRIINVASQTHWNARINLKDLNSSGHYDPHEVYAVTKLMNILFTFKLAGMLRGTGVTANCLHPGAVNTNLLFEYHGKSPWKHFFSLLINSSPAKGARTPVFLAASPDVEGVSGKYFANMREKETAPAALDTRLADKLWEISSRLCGVHKTA